VGEKRECATKNGVVDLLGNVGEWVYSCNFIDETDPAPTGCMVHGGGYDRELSSCGDEATIASDTREPSLGFRCCADLSREEEAVVANASAR
jgi:formylglycine-generating enzyme required for sulfatase activity